MPYISWAQAIAMLSLHKSVSDNQWRLQALSQCMDIVKLWSEGNGSQYQLPDSLVCTTVRCPAHNFIISIHRLRACYFPWCKNNMAIAWAHDMYSHPLIESYTPTAQRPTELDNCCTNQIIRQLVDPLPSDHNFTVSIHWLRVCWCRFVARITRSSCHWYV